MQAITAHQQGIESSSIGVWKESSCSRANISSEPRPQWQTQKGLSSFHLDHFWRTMVGTVSPQTYLLPEVTRNVHSMYQNILRTPHRKPSGNSSGVIGWSWRVSACCPGEFTFQFATWARGQSDLTATKVHWGRRYLKGLDVNKVRKKLRKVFTAMNHRHLNFLKPFFQCLVEVQVFALANWKVLLQIGKSATGSKRGRKKRPEQICGW